MTRNNHRQKVHLTEMQINLNFLPCQSLWSTWVSSPTVSLLQFLGNQAAPRLLFRSCSSLPDLSEMSRATSQVIRDIILPYRFSEPVPFMRHCMSSRSDCKYLRPPWDEGISSCMLFCKLYEPSLASKVPFDSFSSSGSLFVTDEGNDSSIKISLTVRSATDRSIAFC